MTALHDRRCLNHRDREAAARCPSCRDFFCRECVTEHQGRVVCAACLATFAVDAQDESSRVSIAQPALAFFSFLLVWAFFLLLGRTLLLLPDAFHHGTVWGTGDAAADIGDEP